MRDMRTNLTKTKAQQLLQAREATGKSQYELADELGWVRSKIKRIEKGEVSSIDTRDLEKLEKVLGLKSPDNVIVLESPKPRKGKAGGLFTALQQVDRGVAGDNQVFFRVRMDTTMRGEDLLRREATCLGYKGAIHGVESAVDQDPLKIGTEVVIMLWAPNIRSQQVSQLG